MTAVAGTRPHPSRSRAAWRAWTSASEQRPPLYVLIVAVVAVLNVIGMVMVLSASSVASLSNYGSAWFFFERQLIWTALGAAAFLVVSRVDYHSWQRHSRLLMGLSVTLLVLVLLPGLGTSVDGATRWVGHGQWRFQPTDVAKFALLVYAADLLARRRDQLDDWRAVLRPALCMYLVLAALIMLQPDMDAAVVMAFVLGAVLLVGGVKMRHWLLVGAAGASLALVFVLAAPYRRARLFAFLDPWHDTQNTGYQISQSLIALGSGGWTGVGLGQGRAKWLFLPNPHTDFIFAIIGEELGLVGCLIVVSLFVGFAVFGVIAARRAPDPFGRMLAAGITVWIVGQAVINIGMVVGLLPVSGIPLPFVSFGGSSLMLTMAAAGVLANVARRTAR